MPAIPSRASGGRLRSACEHLLYRLPGNAELTRDVCLGKPVPDELPDQVAALGREQPRLPHVLERLGPNLPQPVERLLMVGDVSRHAGIMTTPGCQCQRGVVRVRSRSGSDDNRVEDKHFHDALRLACTLLPRVCLAIGLARVCPGLVSGTAGVSGGADGQVTARRAGRGRRATRALAGAVPVAADMATETGKGWLGQAAGAGAGARGRRAGAGSRRPTGGGAGRTGGLGGGVTARVPARAGCELRECRRRPGPRRVAPTARSRAPGPIALRPPAASGTILPVFSLVMSAPTGDRARQGASGTPVAAWKPADVGGVR
jgi:hypothetical protein